MDARIALPGSSYSREALQALEKCRRVSGARRSADIKNARDDAGVFICSGGYCYARCCMHGCRIADARQRGHIDPSGPWPTAALTIPDWTKVTA